jgi:hypothetical protein
MRAIATVLVLTMAVATVRADEAKPLHEETIAVHDPGARQKKFALGVAVGGGVLIASSFAVSLLAKNRYERCVQDSMVSVAPGNSSCPYTDPAEATDYANDQRWLARSAGTSLFVAGVAALGTALVIRATAPMKRRTVRVGVSPVVSTTGGGLSFGGRF